LKVDINPIGFFYTNAKKIPRHWTVSNVEGTIHIRPEFSAALRDITPGQHITVIFLFHKSPKFTSDHLFQKPPNRKRELGVFSICSPVRPNPIGFSVLEVLDIAGGKIKVNGIDMMDGTPILDIKPNIQSKADCPSCNKKMEKK
jgi:tRNA-Thr(GGU) m(6)t(6)A37 methyltransferase TsaA